jgi:hypothetical protein
MNVACIVIVLAAIVLSANLTMGVSAYLEYRRNMREYRIYLEEWRRRP